MSKRQVVVLWVVALVLLVAAIAARSGRTTGFESKTERSRGQTVLSTFPADQVAKLKIVAAKDTTTLVRKDGQWSVEEREGYPADPKKVNELLRTLAEVEVTEGVEADPSFAPRFGMDATSTDPEEHGTDITLWNEAGEEVAHVTLGKNLESGGDDPMAMMMGGGGGATGRFIRNHADKSGVYKVSEMFPTLTPEPRQWLDETFVKVEKIRTLSVSPNAQPSKIDWQVTRPDENGEFVLEGAQPGESIDPNATSGLKTLLSYARFDDLDTGEDAGKGGDSVNARTVKIETFEGFNYTFTLTPLVPEKPPEPQENAAPPEEQVLLSVEVSAEIPVERKKEEGESEEDAKAKDAAFTTRKAELEKRLATEKAFEGKLFKVSRFNVDAVMKDRSQIVKVEAPGAPPEAPGAGLAPEATPGRPIGAMLGNSPAVTPAMPVPPRRVTEAVTPPIAVPPLEEEQPEPAAPPAEEPEPATPPVEEAPEEKPEEAPPESPENP